MSLSASELPGYSERGLHGNVVHTLGVAIARGELPPGSHLDTEEIEARFRASRTAVREAFRVLAAKGMVEARPRVGTRVQPIDNWNLLDRDVIAWRAEGGAEGDLLREYLVLRLAIEPLAASLAASSSDSQGSRRLDAVCRRMREAVEAGDDQAWVAADVDFHQQLLAASTNRLFIQLSGVVSASLLVQGRVLVPDEAACEQHELVARAIARGDDATAEQTMRDLLKDGMHHVDVRFGGDDSA